jgi:hypothetical protein
MMPASSLEPLKRWLARPGVQISFLCVLIVISRWITRARTLYEWDSVGYARALTDFNIIWHHPHPPGYIFYVAFGRLFNLLVPDANDALILLNICLSILILILVYRLALDLFDQATALTAGWLIVCLPMFWFYGSVAAIYTADAFTSAVIGLLCWQVMRGKPWAIVAAAFALGCMGGFRQTITLLLFPLCLYSILHQTRDARKLILCAAALGCGIASWFLPTIFFSGGVSGYLASSQGLSAGAADKLTIFFKTVGWYYLVNSLNLSVWLVQMIGVAGVLFIPWIVWEKLRGKNLAGLLKDQRLVFLALWFLPGFLFYGLVFLDKPGYLLVVFPVTAMVTARSIQVFGKVYGGLMSRRNILGLNLLLGFLWFCVPAHLDGVYRRIQYPEAILPRPPQSEYAWDLSTREIQVVDARLNALRKVLRVDAGLSAENTVIVVRGGYPDWRQVGYYLPDYRDYWLIDTEISGIRDFHAEAYVVQDQREESASGLPFWVVGQRPDTLEIQFPAGTRTILWLMPRTSQFYKELAAKGLITTSLQLRETGETIDTSSIIPGNSFGVSVFTFQTK